MHYNKEMVPGAWRAASLPSKKSRRRQTRFLANSSDIMKKYAYAIVLITISACSGEDQVSSDAPSSLDYEAKAKEFAEALVANKYKVAFEMLSSSLQAKSSPAELQSAFKEMTDYGEGKPRVDGYVHKMENWPDKRASDIGWAYISISGDNYLEAVTVIVSFEDDTMKIREIEWGRP